MVCLYSGMLFQHKGKKFYYMLQHGKNLEHMLSERSLSQKAIYCMIPFYMKRVQADP